MKIRLRYLYIFSVIIICRCGFDEKLECEPLACEPQPMMQKMLAIRRRWRIIFFIIMKPGLDNKSEFLLHPIKFCHSLFSKKSPQETEKSCDMNANPLKTILPDDSFTEKSFVLKSGFF